MSVTFNPCIQVANRTQLEFSAKTLQRLINIFEYMNQVFILINGASYQYDVITDKQG